MRSLVVIPGLLVGLLLGCASPQPATAPVASVGPAPPSESDRAKAAIAKSIETGEPIQTSDGSKLVCKQESVTNTRLRNRKVCLTEQQWAQRTDTARDAFKESDQPGLPPKGN